MVYRRGRRSGRGLKTQIVPQGVSNAVTYTTAGALSNPALTGYLKRFGRAINKRVVNEARDPKSSTSFERKMGIRKRPMKMVDRSSTPGVYVPTFVSAPRKGRGGENKIVTSRYGKSSMSLKKLQQLTTPIRVIRFGGSRKIDQVSAPGNDNASGLPGLVAAGTNFPGWFLMRYANDTASVGNGAAYPYYVLDLTRTNNTGPSAALRNMRVDSTGRVTFNAASGANMLIGGAGATTSFMIESSTENMGTSTVNRSYFSPQWYDIRLQLFGATASQTRYIIEYVQVLDDHFDPWWDDSGVANTGSDTTARQSRERTAFYLNQVRPLVNNHISDEIRGRRTKNGFKVLKRWVYDVKPHLTIESDSTPNSVTAKLFLKDGRVLRYRADDPPTDLTEVNDAVDDPLDVVQDIPQGNPRLDHPNNSKARRYLVIKASNYTNTIGFAATNIETPSFNMLFRKKEFASEH